jgi:uncharacterized protein
MRNVLESLAVVVPLHALVLASALLWATGIADAADQVQKIQISSASIGQSAHFFATTWSKLINTKTPGLLATNAATGGFVENLQLLGQGKTDVGYLSALNLVKASAGDRSLISEKEFSVLRGIYSYRAGAIHLVVLADSNIRSIADLKGKKVTGGPAGGITRTFLRDLLEAGGLKPGSYTEHVLSTTGGVDALKDGVVDAVCTAGVAPLPVLIDLVVNKKIRILPLDESQVQRLSQRVPSYVREVIPRDIYGKNLITDKDIVTAGTTSMAATHQGMDREVVYKITKVLFANLDEYYTSHPSAKRTSLEDPWPGMVIPLHAGALKFYREAGKDVPARLVPPEK